MFVLKPLIIAEFNEVLTANLMRLVKSANQSSLLVKLKLLTTIDVHEFAFLAKLVKINS